MDNPPRIHVTFQDRPDLVNDRDSYVAMRGMQLCRRLKEDEAVVVPVGAVLSGRRNNPPDPVAGFRSLAVCCHCIIRNCLSC